MNCKILKEIVIAQCIAVTLGMLISPVHSFDQADNQSIATLKSFQEMLYMTTKSSSTIYHSTDLGNSWDSLSSICDDNCTVNDFHKTNNTMWAATSSGLFFKTNSDSIWGKSAGLENQQVNKIINFHETLLAGTDSGIFHYNSLQNKWDLMPAVPLEDPNGNKQCISITSVNSKLFAIIGKAIFSSENNGLTWSSLSNHKIENITNKQIDSNFLVFEAILPVYLGVSSGKILAASVWGDVLVSEDLGATWLLIKVGDILSRNYLETSAFFADSAIILMGRYSGTEQLGIADTMILSSYGKSYDWEKRVVPSKGTINCFTRMGEYMLAGTDSGIIYSKDGFKTWSDNYETLSLFRGMHYLKDNNRTSYLCITNCNNNSFNIQGQHKQSNSSLFQIYICNYNNRLLKSQ